MKFSALGLIVLIAACSAGPETNEGRQADANRSAATMEAQAGLEPQTPETILGAIDGPCGAPKADGFLGTKWTGDSAAAMKAKSGADEVKLFRFNDAADPDEKMNERRLNVYLSPSERVVHLVCG